MRRDGVERVLHGGVSHDRQGLYVDAGARVPEREDAGERRSGWVKGVARLRGLFAWRNVDGARGRRGRRGERQGRRSIIITCAVFGQLRYGML